MHGAVILLCYSTLAAARLSILSDPPLFERNVTATLSSLIVSHFPRGSCLQVVAERSMADLVGRLTCQVPVYQVGTARTGCASVLLAVRRPKESRLVLQHLPREARILLITAGGQQAVLQEAVVQHFFLDVTLVHATRHQVSAPLQLGYVVGSNGRVNLRGRLLQIVGVINPPFVVVEPHKKVKISGVEVRVLRELAFTMNFTWKVREPLDGKAFGERNETGHWTGLKGELANGRTDLGIALLYLNLEHYLTFQMSTPYTMVCLTFLVPAPQKILGHWLALLRPLRWSSWLTFAFVAAIHVLVLRAVARKLSLTSCLLETIRGAALVSGPQPADAPNSQRVLLASWLIGSFLVAGLYSSELSAWMVAQITQPPLRTLRDLARSDVSWGQLDSNMVSVLQKSNSITSRDLVRKFQLANSKQEMERKVLAGKYGLVVHVLSDGYPSGAEFLSREARRRLAALQECVSSLYIAVGMRQGLPLVRAIDLELRRLQEAGLLQEWQARDVWTFGDRAEYKKQRASSEPVQPLDLNNMAGAFGFWMLGHLLAALVFLAEILRTRFKIVYVPRE